MMSGSYGSSGQGMNPWQMGALGGAGAADIGSMFMNKNPANSAMSYFNQIPGTIKPYYQPFIDAGSNASSELQGQYGNLLNDPGGELNKIGAGYHKSPGFDFALQQALQGAGHAAAAGGMAGSPQHEQQNMELATNLGNQDYNSWISNALGLYGHGLSGEQDMFHTGYDASNELAQSLGNNLATQGSLRFQGQQQQNQSRGDSLGSLAQLGMLAAFL